MSRQKDVFEASEGDGWFRRNQQTIENNGLIRGDVVARIGRRISCVEARVLEVGCANGANLAALGLCVPIRGFGIDPSSEAIQNGKRRFPSLDLRTGTADALPFERGSVDVLWFGFCLYLVDRNLLQTAVAEADRVLSDGGLLVIHDFDPGSPRRRRYAHHEGLWSYKMDYSLLFTANPAYALVEKSSHSHAGLQWNPDPDERVGLWILRKSDATAYPVAGVPADPAT